MIQQRLHQNDTTAHMLKVKKKVKHICLPGELREYGEFLKPAYLIDFYQDNLLDPIRMNWDVLGEMKEELGQYGYAGQIGQNPVPPSGGMFKVARLEYVKEMIGSGHIENSVRYWDKAATDDGGCYTVGVLMHKLKNRKKWLVSDVVRGQWDTDDRERIIYNTAVADGPEVVVVVEQEPGSGGVDSARSTIGNLAGFSVRAERPTGNKVYRADPFSVQVNYGNVLLLVAPWLRAFVGEMQFYPFSTYKDQIDAASGAFRELQAGSWGGTF
jgi:predicted phage terminase large subunit-like protein